MPRSTDALNAWMRAPLGRTLLSAEAAVLGDAFEDVFGWELLQIGPWGPGSMLLQRSRTRTQTLIVPPDAVADVAEDAVNRPSLRIVAGRLAQLPIVNDSVDAVLLPHTLEFESDPFAIVREVDRVLVGEGQLLVLGFRPLSLWGLRAAATRAGFPPGLRRVLPVRRVRDWLDLLGYEVVDTRYYLHHRPWGIPRPGDEGRAQFLRRGLLNPMPAGAYLMKARKRVYTLTPVRPRWRERRQVLGGLVEPSSSRAPSSSRTRS